MAGLQRLGVAPEELAAFETPVATTEDMLELMDVVGPWYLPHSAAGVARGVMSGVIYRQEGSSGGSGALAGWDVTTRLPEIDAPALVLTGADDFCFRPKGHGVWPRPCHEAELTSSSGAATCPSWSARTRRCRSCGTSWWPHLHDEAGHGGPTRPGSCAARCHMVVPATTPPADPGPSVRRRRGDFAPLRHHAPHRLSRLGRFDPTRPSGGIRGAQSTGGSPRRPDAVPRPGGL